MNIEALRNYCLSKPGTTESFPFNEVVLVFKVMGKMFFLTSLDKPDTISLKCDPERAVQLRESHPCVQPGYHLNKRMWITVTIDGTLSPATLREWIDHSYDEVVKTLPKKTRAGLLS